MVERMRRRKRTRSISIFWCWKNDKFDCRLISINLTTHKALFNVIRIEIFFRKKKKLMLQFLTTCFFFFASRYHVRSYFSPIFHLLFSHRVRSWGISHAFYFSYRLKLHSGERESREMESDGIIMMIFMET